MRVKLGNKLIETDLELEEIKSFSLDNRPKSLLWNEFIKIIKQGVETKISFKHFQNLSKKFCTFLIS